jgi:cysteine desulfurase
MARQVLEDARSQVAELLGTRPRQVIFTSGATESVHAAVYGACARWVPLPGGDGRPRLVVPAVEHSCVREASLRAGAVRWLGVDATGRVSADEAVAALSAGGDPPALVHCQWANHEVGTLQPVSEVVDACRKRGILVHVDAAAAAGHVPVGFDDLGADLMSVSAHKMGGPPGIGALLIRRGLRIPPLLVGGAQERARRAGLENVAAAAAWGAVAEGLAGGGLAAEMRRAAAQVARLEATATAVEGVRVFGPADAGQRLPYLECLGIDGVEPEAVLLGLDQAGVAVHSGSACASEDLEPSPVLAAMGVDAERSLRLSVGWSTTDGDVDRFAACFASVVGRLRGLRAATAGG